jgi:hypothetical protein
METRYPRLLLAAALLTGCAAPGIQKPLDRIGYLGMGLCPAADGIQIVKINSDTPAEKARLKSGDIIIGYGGLDLSRPESRQRLLWDIRDGAGKKIELTVKRGAKTLTLKPVPDAKDLYPADALKAALSDEIVTGRGVAVAVIVEQINHTKPEFFGNAAALESWKTNMKNTLENNFENLLLNKLFLRCGNYKVADRRTTDQVLREQGFQMTGAVSAETAKDMGKLVGASHLLFLNFTRSQQSSGVYEDDTNARLVNVETGTVLASARFRQSIEPK